MNMEDMLTDADKHNFEMDNETDLLVCNDGVTENLHSICELGDLPEICIAMILSWLSPREIGKLACVCRTFHAASHFDSVWERMLPSTYKEMLSLDPAAVPTHFASKKELFDHLCKPVLFANGTQGFWVDRETGGICLSVAARGMTIVWSDDSRYWSWFPDPSSLFSEVACLKHVCWFEAKGQLECILPPGAYTFSWRVLLDNPNGWRSEPAHFTFSKNDIEDIECKVMIDPRPETSRQQVEQFKLPTIRNVENGWREYDIGEFLVEKGEGTCILKFAMMAIHRAHWKSGICMDGVILRPTSTIRQSVTSPHGESDFHSPEFQPEGIVIQKIGPHFSNDRNDNGDSGVEG